MQFSVESSCYCFLSFSYQCPSRTLNIGSMDLSRERAQVRAIILLQYSTFWNKRIQFELTINFSILIIGRVNTDKIYGKGRYFVGPDHKFLKYQADAHLVQFDDLAVFSDGGADSVGLSFLIGVDFTYFLNQTEIGQLHKELAS